MNTNILNLLPYVYDKFILFILIFTRISALFSTFIVFRRDIVNARTLVSLAALLSVYVMMLKPMEAVHYDVFSLQMTMQLVFQSFVGFLAGFILNIVFEVFSALGQIVSMQIGLGMASLIDPKLGNITTLTHFYTFSIIVIFLLLNGHIFAIQTILDSFTVIPLNHMAMPSKLLSEILSYSSIIFSGSILLSITVVIVMLVTNFAIATMSKFAPQFNVFSIGINLSLVIGLICIYLTFDLYIDKATSLLEQGMNFLKISLVKMT